jgi:hypothetical protein
VKSRVKFWPPPLLAAVLAGVVFTGLFVAAWVEFFFGDGDEGRAAVCTAFECLAGPLLVGAVQALRGRRSCLRLLRVGSVLFIAQPHILRALWRLEVEPWYIEYMGGCGNAGEE